jgi:hypothetical protein
MRRGQTSDVDPRKDAKKCYTSAMGHTRPRYRWTPWGRRRDPPKPDKQELGKRPPTGGGAIYPQTGQSHVHVKAKEEVDGVLGALGGAQDPRTFCVKQTAPRQRKEGRQWNAPWVNLAPMG